MNDSSRTQIIQKLSPLELHDSAPWNNIVCGILVFISRGVVRPVTERGDWNLFITGIVICLVALTTMIAHGNVSWNYWSALNAFVGLWLIVSTRVLPTAPEMTWAQVCLGVLTITIALTSVANERPAK